MVVVGATVVAVVGTVTAADVVGAAVVEGDARVAAGAVVGVEDVVAGAALVKSGSEAGSPHPATTSPSTTVRATSLDTRPDPVPKLVTRAILPVVAG